MTHRLRTIALEEYAWGQPSNSCKRQRWEKGTCALFPQSLKNIPKNRSASQRVFSLALILTCFLNLVRVHICLSISASEFCSPMSLPRSYTISRLRIGLRAPSWHYSKAFITEAGQTVGREPDGWVPHSSPRWVLSSSFRDLLTRQSYKDPISFSSQFIYIL